VLEAGPHAERVPFDPKAAAAKRAGDIDIAHVGKGAAMPWEADGRKWHTQDRVTTKGTAPKWDGAALDVIEKAVQAIGGFSPTAWNTRSIVEIAGVPKSVGWFLHALTGLEGYLTLAFRVGKNTFKTPDLTAKLGLKPLSDFAGFEHYAREKRVAVSQGKGPWQDVCVTVVRKEEVETPAFREFLKRAADSFHAQVGRLKTNVEDVMPWKTNGEAWHLGPKGFPPGKGAKWDRGVLPALLAVVRAAAPNVEIKWDVRDAVTFRVPGISRMWGRLKTKEPTALEAWFVGKPGQFNLSRVERFGRHPEIVADRADGADVLKLRFLAVDQLRPKELEKLLAEHLASFREAFGE
jgi:excinuclease ABC subunit A